MTTSIAGKVVRYEELEFFVEQGLIACVDNRDVPEGRGSKTHMTPAELRERIKYLGWAMRRNPDCNTTNVERDENPAKQRRFNELEELAQIATDMGSPADPAFQAHRVRHRPGHKSRVSLSAGSDPAGYPSLPEFELGVFTGRTAVPDGVLATPGGGANLSGGVELYQPPRRRSRTGLVLPNY